MESLDQIVGVVQRIETMSVQAAVVEDNANNEQRDAATTGGERTPPPARITEFTFANYNSNSALLN
eukprot:1222593-Amphidinium_carterae.1